MMLMFMLISVVIVVMVAALPIWPHSKSWSFRPIGWISTILVIIVIWLLLHRR